MLFKGVSAVSALLFCMLLQPPGLFPAEAGAATDSTGSANQDDPGVATTPIVPEGYVELLQKLDKLEALQKFEKCYRDTISICDKEYEQCSKEPEIRHPALNGCLEIKFDCLETCKRDCSICCNRDGTPECSRDCRIAKGSCDEKCADNGTKCTMEAMMGKQVKPTDKNCEERYKQCVKVVEELCVEDL